MTFVSCCFAFFFSYFINILGLEFKTGSKRQTKGNLHGSTSDNSSDQVTWSILITTTNLPISTDSNDFTKSSDFCFRLNSLKLRLEWKTNQKGNKETSIKQNKVKEGGGEVARVFGYLPGKISNNKNNSTFIWLLKYYNFNQKAILS